MITLKVLLAILGVGVMGTTIVVQVGLIKRGTSETEKKLIWKLGVLDLMGAIFLLPVLLSLS